MTDVKINDNGLNYYTWPYRHGSGTLYWLSLKLNKLKLVMHKQYKPEDVFECSKNNVYLLDLLVIVSECETLFTQSILALPWLSN